MKTKSDYAAPYGDHPELLTQIRDSEEQPSLAQLVERWLERTPGISSKGFNFWERFQRAVKTMLNDDLQAAQVGTTSFWRCQRDKCMLSETRNLRCDCRAQM